jgi:hypothetical protein
MPDRMRNNNVAKVGEAQPFGLSYAERHEHVRDKRHRGDTDLFKFDGVVETPRRASPSIGHRPNGDVDYPRYPGHKTAAGRRVRLGEVRDRCDALLRSQSLAGSFKQLSATRLAVVNQAHVQAAERRRSRCELPLRRSQVSDGIQYPHLLIHPLISRCAGRPSARRHPCRCTRTRALWLRCTWLQPCPRRR